MNVGSCPVSSYSPLWNDVQHGKLDDPNGIFYCPRYFLSLNLSVISLLYFSQSDLKKSGFGASMNFEQMSRSIPLSFEFAFFPFYQPLNSSVYENAYSAFSIVTRVDFELPIRMDYEGLFIGSLVMILISWF